MKQNGLISALVCMFVAVCLVCCQAKSAKPARQAQSAAEQEIKIGLSLSEAYTVIRIQNFGGVWQCLCSYASGTELLKDNITLPEGEDIVIQSTKRGLIAQLSSGEEQRPYYKDIILSGGGLLSAEMPEKEPILMKGKLDVINEDGKIAVINTVPLEEAVISIVSCLADTNEPEALKAIIIMMRTRLAYLIKHKPHPNKGFDICSKAHCAVFSGCSRDRELVRLLSAETKDKYLTYKSKLIFPRYTSCCGGHISSAAKVYNTNEPYHTSKYDLLDGKGSDNCFHSPGFHWQCELKNEEILDFLAVAYAGGADNIFTSWAPSSIDENGRIIEVKISGKTEKTVLGCDFLNALREYFGPNSIKSMKFNTDIKHMSVVFQGMGQGEGVGLCVYGADGLAKKGQSCENILSFYYDNCAISPFMPE